MNEQEDPGNIPDVLSEDLMNASNDFVSASLQQGIWKNRSTSSWKCNYAVDVIPCMHVINTQSHCKMKVGFRRKLQ